MRRAALAISALALLGASAGGALAVSTIGLARPSVTLSDCHPSAEVRQRQASFTGRMREIPGSARMAMRFTLLERLDSLVFKPVPLADLRQWRRSRPGVRAFTYTQRVTALRDGGAYRMRVRFRWYGRRGQVLRTIVGRSRACRQPAPLPNLRVTSISAGPGGAYADRTYSVTVANVGRGEAREFDVWLKVDGAAVGSARVRLLPGEESTVVQIPGPAGTFTLHAIADPTDAIRETDDTDNALSVPCTRATA